MKKMNMKNMANEACKSERNNVSDIMRESNEEKEKERDNEREMK